jgi:hypothetical protein
MMLSMTLPLTPEQTVGLLAVLILIGAAVYLFCRWLLACPRTPDPWASDIEQAVEQEEAVPVCPHCLTPQEHNGWFCPECGSTSGQYSNYLPFVYLFSIGDAVRAGVQQRNRWSPLLAVGFVLVAFAWLSILAPIYCVFLFLARSRVTHLHQPAQAEGPGA